MRLDGFEGRVALVTGAARGIGRRIAETLPRSARRPSRPTSSRRTSPGILGIALDVTDEASVDAAFAAIEAEHGHVEILVLNAGIFVIEPLAETTLDELAADDRDQPRRRVPVHAARAAAACARAATAAMVALGSSAGITRRQRARRRLRRVEGRPDGADEGGRAGGIARRHHRQRRSRPR